MLENKNSWDLSGLKCEHVIEMDAALWFWECWVQEGIAERRYRHGCNHDGDYRKRGW
jgi:hypothetical protein